MVFQAVDKVNFKFQISNFKHGRSRIFKFRTRDVGGFEILDPKF